MQAEAREAPSSLTIHRLLSGVQLGDRRSSVHPSGSTDTVPFCSAVSWVAAMAKGTAVWRGGVVTPAAPISSRQSLRKVLLQLRQQQCGLVGQLMLGIKEFIGPLAGGPLAYSKEWLSPQVFVSTFIRRAINIRQPMRLRHLRRGGRPGLCAAEILRDTTCLSGRSRSGACWNPPVTRRLSLLEQTKNPYLTWCGRCHLTDCWKLTR